ncbi:hypothetical protein COOONC_27413 [Cooperia oncophora]
MSCVKIPDVWIEQRHVSWPLTIQDDSGMAVCLFEIRIESHGLLQKNGSTRKTPLLGQLDFMAENGGLNLYYFEESYLLYM